MSFNPYATCKVVKNCKRVMLLKMKKLVDCLTYFLIEEFYLIFVKYIALV